MGSNRSAGDSTGVAVAFTLGLLVGLALAAPAVPRGGVSVGGVAFDSVGSALVVAVLSVLLLPLGILTLYQLFSLFDR